MAVYMYSVAPPLVTLCAASPSTGTSFRLPVSVSVKLVESVGFFFAHLLGKEKLSSSEVCDFSCKKVQQMKQTRYPSRNYKEL